MPPPLSPGKVRGLQVCATPEGLFTILAADHRDSLRALIAPDAPQTVTSEQLTRIKLTLVERLSSAASAVVLDPVYSAGQSITGGQLPGRVGLLCALEEQGYLGDPRSRRTAILAGWSAEKARRLGANGVKLSLFYHPAAGPATEAQECLARSIAADCRRYGLPLFLEPVTYSTDPRIQKGSHQFALVRRQLVIEAARRLSLTGAEVMKVEFPVDVRYELDQGVWAEACAELNEASQVPWTLLSAGEPFDTFKRQLRIACEAGCSGFVTGRAIWQEAARLSGEERTEFLIKIARQRLRELSDIATEYGMPWRARCSTAQVDEH